MRRLFGAAGLLGAAGLAPLLGVEGVPKPRVRSSAGIALGGVALGAREFGAVLVGVVGLNGVKGVGTVLIGPAVPPGFGLAATTAAEFVSDSVVENVGWDVLARVFAVAPVFVAAPVFVVGDASTMRIGSSAVLLALVEKGDVTAADLAAGAVISLRIVPPSAVLVELVGAVTIGGSVLPVKVGVAAGGW